MFGNYSTQPYLAPNQPTGNPYLDRLNAMQSMAPAPRYEIIHVNGRPDEPRLYRSLPDAAACEL